MRISNQLLLILILWCTALTSGCATFTGNSDGPTVRVVGIEPLEREGLEVRFALKLRIQNPNESDLAYDGLSVRLAIDGRGLASGVSNTAGKIPRFSEDILTIPVSITAFSLFRQMLALTNNSERDIQSFNEPVSYKLTGKLGAAHDSFGATRFSDQGELDFLGGKNDDQ